MTIAYYYQYALSSPPREKLNGTEGLLTWICIF